MTGICICCGRITSIQMHHPGRRECADITVPVCQDCHSVLTIRDGGRHGERQWKPGANPVIRVRAGIADILQLVSARNGWDAIADDAWQVVNGCSSEFTVRYSASDTAYAIGQVIPDDRPGQMEEIRLMMRGYQRWLSN